MVWEPAVQGSAQLPRVMAGRDAEARHSIEIQLERILESPAFVASQRPSEFLKFVCAAALEGRSDVGQTEIARTVLGLGEDFNPTEDTSVRKLATTVRHRLERYYKEQGASDAVVVTLPQRTYVPHFRMASQEPVSSASTRPVRRMVVWAAVSVGLMAVLVISNWPRRPAEVSDSAIGRFVVPARKGSIIYGRTDAPPESLQLGPLLEATDQVVARMVFTPRTQYDQAGIMVFVDPDNYVRLGRHLRRRNSFIFASEIRGARSIEAETFSDDPLGQTGEPVWLAIRRVGDEFRAFTSTDGWNWFELANVVKAPLPAAKARVALYAFSDTESEHSPRAVFDHVSYGPPAATWGGVAGPPTSFAGWHARDGCPGESTVTQPPQMLKIEFADARSNCDWELLHTVPAGDWSLTGIVDNCPWARTNAGMILRGDRAMVSVLRNEWQGGSIVVGTGQMRLFHRPDLAGDPPLAIRIRREGGRIHAEAGPSLNLLEPLLFRLGGDELGKNLEVGFQTSRIIAQPDTRTAPVALRHLAFDVLSLEKYR
jgi:regulation of enolase protein 1 (concanavalin A-like superfamily)